MSYPRKIISSFILMSSIVTGFAASAEDLIGDFPNPTQDLVNNVVQYVDGEQFNALTGEMGYYLTDFAIEGNGPTIELGRKFQRNYGYPHEFDTMSLEFPRIEFFHLGGLAYQQKKVDRDWVNDYSKPPIGNDRCAGLNMYVLGKFVRKDASDNDDSWAYGASDLNSGIRLYIRGKPINFFPTESILNATRFPAGSDYVSPSNWYINCEGTQWVAKSPTGMKYTFDQYEHVYAGRAYVSKHQAKVNIYVSKVEDTYGNTLTYSYDSMNLKMIISGHVFKKRLLKSITANDGRALSLIYSGGKVTSITDNGIPNPKSLRFTYRTSGDNKGLEKVIRADSSYWEYQYTRSLANVYDPNSSKLRSGISLTNIKTPTGLSVVYSQLGHNTRFHTDPSGKLADYSSGYLASYNENFRGTPWDLPFRPALRQRTFSGPGIPAGMTWRYDYFKLGVNNKAATYITGPTVNQKLTFRRLDYHHSPLRSYIDSGRLLEAAVYPAGTSFSASGTAVALKKTTTTWLQRPSIVDQTAINNGWSYNWGYGAQYTAGFWSSYHVADNTEPSVITTTIDGETFKKTYSNFDAFDNPRTLTETGNATGQRVTNFTYHNDTNNWIVGKLKDETLVNGGPGIARTYNSQGDLATFSEHGLSTKDIAYYPTGHLAAGEVQSISWLRANEVLSNSFQDYIRGIPQIETDAAGYNLTRTVNLDGTVASETDKNGKTVSYQYDPLHRISSITTPLYDPTTIAWSSSGRTKTSTLGAYQRIDHFDALGRPIQQIEEDLLNPSIAAIKSGTEYDAAGRVFFQSLLTTDATDSNTAAGSKYEYDGLNRITKLTNTATGGGVTTYCYLPGSCGANANALSHGFAKTDARGFVSIINFEGYGSPSNLRLSEIHDTTGDTVGVPSRLTSIDRNLYGDITQVARGTTLREYWYSAALPRHIEQVIEPETGTTSYTYLDDGTLDTTKTGVNDPVSYVHDKAGRLTNINYPGSTADVRMEYYNKGELNKVFTGENTTEGNVWSYLLNAENDLREETLTVDGKSFKLSYGFNNLGYIDSITYPSNLVVAFANDALGRTISIPGFVASADYHPNGQLSHINYANGQETTLTQNARQLPEQLITARAGNILADLKYDYDLNNNVKLITDPILGNKTLDYDGVNRLTMADGPWGIGRVGYDGNDNLTFKDIGAQTLAYDYGDGLYNQLHSISGSNTYTFGYDTYGNVTTNGNSNFLYDDASNLRISGTNSYQYDGHNRRVIVDNTSGRQHYVYANSGQLMHRFKPAEDQTTDYIYLAGQLIAKLEHKPDPLEEAVAPVFDQAVGTYINNVNVTMGTTTVGGVIHYTTDGSTPTSGSTVYSGSVLITSTTNLKAVVIAGGMLDSAITMVNYTIKADAPVISATYGKQIIISMSTTTLNGVIRYTTNGTTPTESSIVYSGPFPLSNPGTIKAATFQSGKLASEISFEDYFIQATRPTFSPNGGYSSGSVLYGVSLSNNGPVTIYYTKDGSTPTTSSFKYTGVFNLTAPPCRYRDYYLKARAIGAGYISSSITTSKVFRLRSGYGTKRC